MKQKGNYDLEETNKEFAPRNINSEMNFHS